MEIEVDGMDHLFSQRPQCSRTHMDGAVLQLIRLDWAGVAEVSCYWRRGRYIPRDSQRRLKRIHELDLEDDVDQFSSGGTVT